jgi:hypothetical protein
VKKAKESTFAAKGAQQGSKDNSCCIIMWVAQRKNMISSKYY